MIVRTFTENKENDAILKFPHLLAAANIINEYIIQKGHYHIKKNSSPI